MKYLFLVLLLSTSALADEKGKYLTTYILKSDKNGSFRIYNQQEDLKVSCSYKQYRVACNKGYSAALYEQKNSYTLKLRRRSYTLVCNNFLKYGSKRIEKVARCSLYSL